jgi:hypothetical protein
LSSHEYSFPGQAYAVAVAVMAMTVPHAAHAQPMGFTQQMRCSQAAGLVSAQGALVLRTTPTTYGRFVRDQASCLAGQFLEPAWVPTADAAQCFIGYRCRDTDLDNGR